VTAEMKIFRDKNGLSATTSLILPGHFFLLDTYNETRAVKIRTTVKSFKEREINNGFDDTEEEVL
jgi:hypothetical protein